MATVQGIVRTTTKGHIRGLGGDGSKEVSTLFARLGCSPTHFSYRPAPSIITRSEAQLFGVSLPRFAVRVYPTTTDKIGFANLRRLDEFSRQARGWGERFLPESLQDDGCDPTDEPPESSPADIIRAGSCIADCVLRFPETGYQTIQTDLGTLYGEERHWATPFVRHVDLAGGGLCAQASCFMAAALMQPYANGVHGIPDITVLATRKLQGELRLRGLDQREIVDYFNSDDVGLSAIWQAQFPLPDSTGESRNDILNSVTLPWFASVIRSYLRSNCPVLFPNDAGLLSWSLPEARVESIYERNDVAGYDPSEPGGRRDHCCVLVGYSNEDQDEFLLNDPATFPFLKASARQLWYCAQYDSSQTRIGPRFFLPITPRSVRMPLENQLSDSALEDLSVAADNERVIEIVKDCPLGILALSQQASNYEVNGTALPRVWRGPHADEIYLVRSPIVVPKRGPQHWEKQAALEQAIARLELDSGRWLWLQFALATQCGESKSTTQTAWLWDAEVSPLPGHECGKAIKNALLAVFLNSAGTWIPWNE